MSNDPWLADREQSPVVFHARVTKEEPADIARSARRAVVAGSRVNGTGVRYSRIDVSKSLNSGESLREVRLTCTVKVSPLAWERPIWVLIVTVATPPTASAIVSVIAARRPFRRGRGDGDTRTVGAADSLATGLDPEPDPRRLTQCPRTPAWRFRDCHLHARGVRDGSAVLLRPRRARSGVVEDLARCC